MPLQTIICENAEYQLITANKVHELYIMEMLTTLFRAKLTTGLADFGLQQML